MGALIMSHSDNNGLVLPPKLAPIHVVMVPIYKSQEDRNKILEQMDEIKEKLLARGLSVKIDDRDNLRSGFKFAEWELKGVPVRIAIGPKDMEKGTVEVARRDTLTKEFIPRDGVEELIPNLLEEIQKNIYDKALKFREDNTHVVNSYEEFKRKIEEGGFLLCHWDGTAETEEKIKAETKATIRFIPMDESHKEEGKCIYSGKPSGRRVFFARAY
jgi:prolyl-tRNA synthetase